MIVCSEILAGHVSRSMLAGYSHIRSQAKQEALFPAAAINFLSSS
jgi:hypothetical protein